MIRFRKIRRYREPVVYFGLSMIFMIWAGVGLEIRNQFAAIENFKLRDASNYARVFEESVLRSIKQIDTQLWFVSQAAEDLPAANWQEILNELPIDKELTVQLALVNQKGIVAASTIPNWSDKPLNLADREHIRVHLDKKTEGLFISKPVLGRLSGKWSIQLSRAILDKTGGVVGVAVASLDPAHLSRFYASMTLNSGGAIALVGLDGIVRASAGASASMFARDLSGSPLMTGIARTSEGSLVGPIWDASIATTSWRRLDQLDLIVAVSIASPAGAFEAEAMSTFLILATAFLSLVIALTSLRLAHDHQRLALNEVRLQRSRRQIREQSQRLKLTLENMSQGIAMTDPQGRLVVSNTTLVQMLAPHIPPQSGAFASSLKQIIASSQPSTDPSATPPFTPESSSNVPAFSTYQTQSGDILKIVTVTLPDNGMVATFEDVTERRNKQLQLEAARETATQANRAKSEFLASMSHEIRTPMHGIIGMSQVLLESSIAGEQRKCIETIAASGEALMTIINDILDYSRIEAGKLDLRPVDFNLLRMLDDTVTLMSAPASKRGIQITLTYPGQLPRFFHADMGRIRQIVTNLIGNAVKFTTGPRINVVVSGNASGLMSIAVKDEGPGISQNQLAVIFDEFVQLNAPAHRTVAGTGLGLPISRRLAALMGGELTVASVLGEGSVFTITVPLALAQSPAVAATPGAPAQDAAKSTSVQLKSGRLVRILAAEDNKTNRQVLCSMLKTEAVDIILAVDGQEAVDIFKSQRPDIILMDVWMPNVDGFSATALIRELERERGLHRTPIIALTANAVRGDRDKCLAAGIDDYMSKPLYKRILIEMINRWCQPREENERYLLQPLYFSEKRQPANSGKTISNRQFKSGVTIDESRIAVLSTDIGAENLQHAVAQFGTDVRHELDTLAMAQARSDLANIRSAVETIRSCSMNMGCIRLVAACEGLLKGQATQDALPPKTVRDLDELFQSAQRELNSLSTKVA